MNQRACFTCTVIQPETQRNFQSTTSGKKSLSRQQGMRTKQTCPLVLVGIFFFVLLCTCLDESIAFTRTKKHASPAEHNGAGTSGVPNTNNNNSKRPAFQISGKRVDVVEDEDNRNEEMREKRATATTTNPRGNAAAATCVMSSPSGVCTTTTATSSSSSASSFAFSQPKTATKYTSADTESMPGTYESYSTSMYGLYDQQDDDDDDELIGFGTALISCFLSLALGFGLGYGT